MTIDAAAARGVAPAAPRPLEVLSGAPPLPATTARALPYPLVVALAAVVVASDAALRLFGLGAVGLAPAEAAIAGQGAAILGLSEYVPHFAPLTGPPFFLQLALATVFSISGPSDVAARVVAAAFGVGTIAVTYLAARECYGQRVALVASLLVAFMPYHVLVSRQVLVDGPTAFWVTLALFCLARFARTERAPWVLAAVTALGLGVLSKEFAFLFVAVAYAFLASRRWHTLSRAMLLLSAVILTALVATYPLAFSLNGEGQRLTTYLGLQFVERTGQPWHFYLTTVAPAFGLPVLLGLLLWVPVAWVQRTWREALLAAWVCIPLGAFLMWPAREFAFLIALAPAAAIMVARAFEELPRVSGGRLSQTGATVAVGIACVWLAATSFLSLRAALGATDAASALLVGARDTGAWVDGHLPQGVTLLVANEELADVLRFYGHRSALPLTDAPDVLALDPSRPVAENPDRLIAEGGVQYVVWDTQSAANDASKADRLLAQVARHHGREVYRVEAQGATAAGEVTFPVTIVYEVRP